MEMHGKHALLHWNCLSDAVLIRFHNINFYGIMVSVLQLGSFRDNFPYFGTRTQCNPSLEQFKMTVLMKGHNEFS